MQKTMQCWPLHGVGLDNLGKDRKPCDRDVPQPEDDELLVRIDAIGLCFSDIKLIRAGEDHPRVFSEDLSRDPIIPGHEAVMTVVQVGEKLKERFQPGSRWIIQADIYYKGVNIAYGYAINGGMAEYSIIDKRITDGDEGCYLLPLGDSVPAGIAALVEPWTCVIASYLIEHRTAPAAGGKMLVAMEPGEGRVFRFGDGVAEPQPARVDCLNVNAATLANLRAAFPAAEFASIADVPDANEHDDVVLCGIRTRKLGERLCKVGAVNALISLVGDYEDALWSFDVGSIHYKGWFYQGAAGEDIAAAYGRNVRPKLVKGGTCWLLGGAGAMGQMHTQLAVEDPDGPSRILVTDLDSHRIEKMMRLLAPKIAERGIEVKTMTPKDFDSLDAFNAAVAEFAPDGYDDIVMLVPVVPVLNSAVQFLGRDGLMNIFAGIPAGKEAELNIGPIVNGGARYVGSSGSRTWHLQHTLKLTEEGELNPSTALAAIGGMDALWAGLEGVAEARYAGKTVIFPHCPDMPLVPIEDIGTLAPDLVETLDVNGCYTMATEKALFARFSKLGR